MEVPDGKGPGIPEGVGAGSFARLSAGGSGTHLIKGNESGLEEQGSWWAIPKPKLRRTATVAARHRV
jgi:hypothetical protein